MTCVAVRVDESSKVGDARRAAARIAAGMGFDEETIGKVALAVTEASTNLVKHAGGGEVLIRAAEEHTIELVAIDSGPGMADVARNLTDGYSTTGTQGTGLGALSRAATFFELYSARGRGTALVMRISAAVRPPPPAAAGGALEVGAVCVPHPDEEECGDDWAYAATSTGGRVIVADGLGHGVAAASAAREAIATFRKQDGHAPAEIVSAVHDALRSTRGAAVAVAEIDAPRRIVRYCGVGNVSGVIVSLGADRHLVSHNGTAGHEARRVQEFTYPWPDDAVLVLHSDGIASRWMIERYPGLAARHPVLIAAVLYRDHRRVRDDATVVAIRRRAAPGRRRRGGADA